MPQTATETTVATPGARDSSPSPSPERTLRAWRHARRAARRAEPGPIVLPELAVREREIATSAGRIRVREAGPERAPALLFVHGFAVDGRMWSLLAQELAGELRCVMPDLPLGSHTLPLDPGADRTPAGIARLVGELAGALGSDDVTVVSADSGTAIAQLLMDQGAPGIRRVVLTTGDCFDRFFPPGFRLYQRLAHVPPLLHAMIAGAVLRPVRASPIAYGWLTHRPLDDGIRKAWLRPLRKDRAVRADTAAFLRGVSSKELIAAEARLDGFDRPVLLAWSPEQRWFPVEHAHRLAAILPDARVEEIEASGVFPALDRPAELAGLIRAFARD